jgi:release factor glutamine methyltransferase
MPSWTVREAITWAASFLHNAFNQMSGTYASSPVEEQNRTVHYEAMTLLEQASGWSRTQLLVGGTKQLPEEIADKYQQLVVKRASGEPLQYILGEAWFYGRPFTVQPGVLIPRPETEVLAEQACTWIRGHLPTAVVCDIGTGSGCIAVTVAIECPKTTVYAVDVSEDALAVAEQNANQHNAGVRLVHSDGIAWLGKPKRMQESPLNVLVSNPPYIPTEDVEELDVEVRDWEPRIALDGGPDGLDFYRALSQLGDKIFAPGPAALFLEVGEDQALDVVDLFAEAYAELWPGWTFAAVEDLRGILRVVHGWRR